MYSPQISLLLRPSLFPPTIHAASPLPFLKPRPHRRRLRVLSSQNPNPNPNPDLAKDPIFNLPTDVPKPEDEPAAVDGVVVDVKAATEEEEEEEEVKRRLPLVVFLVGVMESVRRGFDRLAMSEWASWFPFWRQEKRLERLIAEADANPKDAAKEGALLAELNKHRY